jgi:hypothetical protein
VFIEGAEEVAVLVDLEVRPIMVVLRENLILPQLLIKAVAGLEVGMYRAQLVAQE